MDKARGLANRFRQTRRERNDVVVCCLFDFTDTRDGKLRAALDLFERIMGNCAHLSMDFTDCDLDVQPFLEFGLFRPKRTHFGQSVSGNHFSIDLGLELLLVSIRRFLTYPAPVRFPFLIATLRPCGLRPSKRIFPHALKTPTGAAICAGTRSRILTSDFPNDHTRHFRPNSKPGIGHGPGFSSGWRDGRFKTTSHIIDRARQTDWAAANWSERA